MIVPSRQRHTSAGPRSDVWQDDGRRGPEVHGARAGVRARARRVWERRFGRGTHGLRIAAGARTHVHAGPVDLVEGEVPVGGEPIGIAAAAALLSLLGVSDEDVLREYLLTNDELVPQLRPVLDKFRAAGGDPELLMPVVGVQREYLEAASMRCASTLGRSRGTSQTGSASTRQRRTS